MALHKRLQAKGMNGIKSLVAEPGELQKKIDLLTRGFPTY